MKMCILMNRADNVATVLENTEEGDVLQILDKNKNSLGEVTATERIPFAHKICVRPIEKNDVVVKFGVVIGRATERIPTGGYAHVHNVISIKGSEEVLNREAKSK